MADKIEEQSWGADLTRRIADRIKRARLANNQSAQDLADRTAQLGHPVTRQVIANLEAHRRRNITMDDLFVIAHALEVSPLVLMFDPTALGAPVEVLPGLTVPQWEAVRWLRGEHGLIAGMYVDDFGSARDILRVRNELEAAQQGARWVLREIDYLQRFGRTPGGAPLDAKEKEARISDLRSRVESFEASRRESERILELEGVDIDSAWFDGIDARAYQARLFEDDEIIVDVDSTLTDG